MQIAAQRQKDGLGLVSGVQLGQRNIKWSEIRRHLRHKGVKDPQRWIAEGHRTTEMQNSKPYLAGSESVHGQFGSALASPNDQTALLHNANMSVKLGIPPFPSFRQEEFFVKKLLRAVHVYCDSEFYAPNTCVRHRRAFLMVRGGQNAFHQLIDSGIHALREQEYEIAFYCFNLASGQIRKLVELNDPRWLYHRSNRSREVRSCS